MAVPDDVADPVITKAAGRVELPLHVRWSGPSKVYDLGKRTDRLRVYEQVLREGNDDDVRRFIDVDELLALWDELVLPGSRPPSLGRVVPPAPRARLGVLSELQRRVAVILSQLPDASGFVLAGGGALIARGDVDRLTRDLDFFTVEPDQVDRLLPVFEAALRADGLGVVEERVSAGFARLVVSDGAERTGVDLAADARLLPAEPSDLGLLLNVEESAVDKVLAIFGRAEARDFVDLAALEPRFGLNHLLELARAKDLGFLPSVFLDMLGRFDRLPRDEFDVDDEVYEAIVESVHRWRLIPRDDDPV